MGSRVSGGILPIVGGVIAAGSVLASIVAAHEVGKMIGEVAQREFESSQDKES